jgi:predicted enzyme related to lactoylglutathione lyase
MTLRGAYPNAAPEGRPMIKRVKFACIPVKDQDRSLKFYTQKLGFTVATDRPFTDTQRWIELRIPGADTMVVLFTADGWEDKIGTFQQVTFQADDVEKTYAELVAKGVQFAGPVQKAEWGSSAIMKDPDGNSFVISSK